MTVMILVRQSIQTSTCNELDDNCDGTIDGRDLSVRLFSISMRMVMGMGLPVSCTVPSGYASELGDCDDTDAAIYPTAIEVCDEIDNNCDALVDDTDPMVVFATTDVWYADADGDRIATDTVKQCEIPQLHRQCR